MSLNGALYVAQAGIAHTNRQLQVVSANIANAETPGYTRKTREGQTVIAGDEAVGLRTGPLQRETDIALQSQLWRSTGDVSSSETMQTMLQKISQAHGVPEDGTSLGGVIGKLQEGFVSLDANPSDSSVQNGILTSALNVTQRFNDISTAIGQTRQDTQDQIVEEVSGLNADLKEINRLTTVIRQQKSAGLSAPDVEDQRDQAIAKVAERLSVRVSYQSDGSVLLATSAGQPLPITDHNVFSTSGALLGAGAYHGGGAVPDITMGSTDVTAGLSGGRLGALITLRDQTLPRMQGEADEAAQKLAFRFEQQGLRLFSDAYGNVPPGGGVPAQAGYVGFAGVIRVNPAVSQNSQLVRDGTHAVSASAGGPTAFTPNPAGGPAGFSTLIDRVLNFALGQEVSPGNPQGSFATTGLGPAGNVSSSFVAPRSISDYATTMTTAQTADIASVGGRVTSETALRDILQTRFQDRVGVDVDQEMSHLIVLQNSYAANARMISAVQTMWDQTLDMVR